jgi:hypothetical protein
MHGARQLDEVVRVHGPYVEACGRAHACGEAIVPCYA